MNNSLVIYIFIGPPGSGKGSLANLCLNYFGWKQLSTGNLCRQHIFEQTEIGKQIDFAIKSGILISDSLISAMVASWLNELKDAPQTVIFDGYPRTVEQADSLVKWIKDQRNCTVDLKVINFFVSDAVVESRLSSRYICENSNCQAIYSLSQDQSKNSLCSKCSGCLMRRSDDEPVAIKKRLVIFHQHKNSVENFLLQKGFPVFVLNAEQSLQAMFSDFKKLICLNEQ